MRCAASPPADVGTNCSSRPVAIITRPNKDLKPEESKSYSVGIVLQPTPTTSMTVDAWQIKRTNEIAQGSTADAIAAGNVLRDIDLINGIAGTGSILAVNTAYINAASTRVRGIDTDIRQTFDIGPGQLEMDLQWSHVEPNVFASCSGRNCRSLACIAAPIKTVFEQINRLLGRYLKPSVWSRAVAQPHGARNKASPRLLILCSDLFNALITVFSSRNRS